MDENRSVRKTCSTRLAAIGTFAKSFSVGSERFSKSMRKAFVAVLMLGLTTIGTGTSVLGQRRVNIKQVQQKLQPQRPAAARGGMLGLIQGMYINQLQRQTEI